MKRVSDTPQLRRAAPGPPTPASLNSSNRPIEKTPLKKKKRSLTPESKRRVAETRKRGACKECRQKKEKCLHATNELGTDGATQALQRSESQDSWCSATSTGSCYSETPNPREDRWAATSVSASLLAGGDQLPSDQLDWVNRDSDTPYQEPRIFSIDLYSICPSNGLPLPDLHPNLDQISPCDIWSQNNSQPSTRGYDMQSISPPTTAYSPRGNSFWPQITQSAGGSSQSPGYLESFRPCALPSAEFQQRPALPETCITHQGFTQPSRQPHCHRCCAFNTVVWEPTPIILQLGMNSSTRMNSNFGSPSSSDIREQTVSDLLFNINTPSEGVISQNSVFMSPMDVDLSRLSYRSQSSFTTNISPNFGRNTFEGNQPLSFSSDGTAMTTDRSLELTLSHTTQLLDAIAPETFQFPQSSTDVGYPPQLTVPDQDFPLVHEPTSINSQPNHPFVHFP